MKMYSTSGFIQSKHMYKCKYQVTSESKTKKTPPKKATYKEKALKKENMANPNTEKMQF